MSSVPSLLHLCIIHNQNLPLMPAEVEILPMTQCFCNRFPFMNQPRLFGTALCISQENEKAFLKGIFLSIHLSFAQRELFTMSCLFHSKSTSLTTEKSLTMRVHSFRVLGLRGFRKFTRECLSWINGGPCSFIVSPHKVGPPSSLWMCVRKIAST